MKDLNLNNSSDVTNFHRQVVNYCNDNESFFAFENGDAKYDGVDVAEQTPGDYTQAALEHYNASAEGYGNEPLEGEHAEEFKMVAVQAHREGFAPHAGSLSR